MLTVLSKPFTDDSVFCSTNGLMRGKRINKTVENLFVMNAKQLMEIFTFTF